MNLGKTKQQDKPVICNGVLTCTTICLLKVWGSLCSVIYFKHWGLWEELQGTPLGLKCVHTEEDPRGC